ncbi:hypothetical protein LY474_02555 [Myxococcus stipitatus]|uniref:hypothetical protein n=1 Tax=Myxococcus stipitatus TaxID=83455 RepID=UPI001F459CD7|nr:hypothetical protein [Myxococcus stipitatus]MCE9666683.1 hypothetical protein [Myxococcus stipitatus]
MSDEELPWVCWSKVKALLRKLAARTVSPLKVAVQQAAEAVTQRDAEGWFIHCGYSVPCD